MRVLVVGAGIIGASIAYHLARAGAEVTLLEKERAAAGASSKSFGWINSSTGNAPRYQRLRQSSMAAFADLNAALGGRLPLKMTGGLWWEEDEALLERAYAELTRENYRLEWLDRRRCEDLVPALKTPPARALFAPDEGCLDCEKAVGVLLTAARELGAELREGIEVRGFQRKAGALLVSTSKGDVIADRLVLAAGADCEGLAGAHGIHLPFKNLPGFLLRSKPAGVTLGPMLLTPNLHIKQDPDGSLVMAEDFGGGPVPEDLDGDIRMLLDKAARLLKGAESLELHAATLGIRPIPADGHPVIGPAPEWPEVYLAVMHSGVTLMPIAGKIAAEEIFEGGETGLDQVFRPERFVIR